MQEKIVLIDYEEKYADKINEIEQEQWGKWCTGDIRDEIGTHTHIKLARIDDDIVACFLDNINKFILNGYKKGKYFIDTVGINNVLLGMNGIRNENTKYKRIISLI